MTELSIYFVYPGDLDTPTGGYHYDRRLIAELRNLGVAVETVSLPGDFPELDQDAKKNIQQSFAAFPDQAIVIVDGLVFGLLDELAADEAQRLRLIALCHHPLALETGLDEAQRLTLLNSERQALKSTRATIVTSEHTRQILIDQFAVSPEKIAVVLPGTDRVLPASCDGNPVRLLTVAALIKRKAHDVLINSLASLKSLPWEARFVGASDFDPAWADSLQQLISRFDLSNRICFAGAVDDIQQEYQQADVFVLPSRFEGYGMVFAEALAAGLPVVAARSGAVPDVVPKDAGLLVAPEDIEGLSDALQQLICNQSFRKRLQLGARHAAANLPSWQYSALIAARKLEEIAGS